MPIQGQITNQGLIECANARFNQGWYMYPTKIYFCETKGAYLPTRTIDSLEPHFYESKISSYTKINDLTIQISATIPIGQNSGVDTVISELAFFAESQGLIFSIDTGTDRITLDPLLYVNLVDGDRITIRNKLNEIVTMPVPLINGDTYFIKKFGGNLIKIYVTKADALADTGAIDISTSGVGNLIIQKEFLLAIAQTNPVREYISLDGGVTFRPQFTLANSGDPDLFKFFYTQAFEIAQHNEDVNAHPIIQTAMNKAGIFVEDSQVDYKGQNFDEKAVFKVGTTDLKPVYLDTDGTYGLAMADGSIKELNFVGFRQGTIVREEGFINIGTHGFTSGIKLYLHPSIAGNLTTTINNSEVGVVLNNNTILLNKKYFPSAIGTGTIDIQDEGSSVGSTSVLNFIGAVITATVGVGVVNVTVIDTDNFLDLTDTPSSYSGQALKYARVNSAETALEFVSVSPTGGQYLNTYSLYAQAGIDWGIATPNLIKNDTTYKGDLFFTELSTGDQIEFNFVGTDPDIVSNQVYYARKDSSSTLRIYNTKANALADTGAIVKTVSSLTNFNIKFGNNNTTPFPLKSQHNDWSFDSPQFLELPLVADLDPTSPIIYVNNAVGGGCDFRMNPTDYSAGVRFRNGSLLSDITSSNALTLATGSTVRSFVFRYIAGYWVYQVAQYI